MATINVKGSVINVILENDTDYISLTDMIKSKDGDFFITDWLRNRNTLEFLSVWESINNPSFNYGEFATIKNQSGLNSFKISVKEWSERTNSIGVIAKAGRYGGTYAHKDIAFEFGTWISPEFKLYLIREFQRLKDEEGKSKNLEWDYRRFLTKVNYRIHTDSVKNNLIVPKYSKLTKEQESYIYADEAEMLNVALFGITSRKWRKDNPEFTKQGLNIRDTANVLQLTVLSNLETLNSHFLAEKISAPDRLSKLKEASLSQLSSLSKINFNYSLESPHLLNKSEN
ncbi:KilA-N domain-containing protein [Aurantibacillus circumpalustris]|uniref:KilA-N domain-containing protein n=1 Tax=Aurantibacillus circumpalustris TaxID=3036359 RepID=UPI00295C0950|nr:KilA-N domain-containing protein [Aurantibacillus circumpalustris]